MKYCLFLDQTGTPRIAPIMAVNNNLNFDGMDCYSSATETIDPGTILNSAMHSDSQPQYLSNGESSINGLEENHDGTNVNAEPSRRQRLIIKSFRFWGSSPENQRSNRTHQSGPFNQMTGVVQ